MSMLESVVKETINTMKFNPEIEFECVFKYVAYKNDFLFVVLILFLLSQN